MRRAPWMHAAATIALIAAPVLASAPGVAEAQPKPAKAAAPHSAEADAKKAQVLFIKGSDLYKAKKYGLALEQFRLSYATVASPNSHLYIARCLAALGETRNAWLEFDKVIDEATERAKTEDRFLQTRDSAKVERDELAPRLAIVNFNVLHADPSSTLRVGAHDVPRARWGHPFPLDPGSVEAVVQTPGRPAFVVPLSVGPGDRREVSIDLNAPVAAGPRRDAGPPPRRGKTSVLRPISYVAAGIGVIGFGMFAVGGALTLSTYASLEKKCGGERACPPGEADSDVSAGKTQQTIANVGLVVGIVGVATGATLFALSLRKPARDSQATTHLVVGPSWGGVQGTF